MYHPSVYDNLKIVLEGAVYDLDFSGELEIINRQDLVDFAIMERTYSTEFILPELSKAFRGKVTLKGSLNQLVTEKLEDNPENAGSHLLINLYTPVYEIETDCKMIQGILKKWTSGVWKSDIEQKLTYIYGEPQDVFHNNVSLTLEKPINEDETEIFSQILNEAIQTIKELNNYFKGYRK